MLVKHQESEGSCTAAMSNASHKAPLRTLQHDSFCFAQADIAPPYNVTDSGSMDIEVKVAKPTPCVVLHAISMDIIAVMYTPFSSAAFGAGDAGAADPVSGVASSSQGFRRALGPPSLLDLQLHLIGGA